MTVGTPLAITAGLPYAKTIVATLPTGRSWWTHLEDFEVRSQIRTQPDEASPLILSLTPYLTVTFDGVDAVTIALSMTGAQTRLVTDSGFYDLVISDPGEVDARAIMLLSGALARSVLVTAAADTP